MGIFKKNINFNASKPFENIKPMQRTDNSPFLLFIEPLKEEKSLTPVCDELALIMDMALDEAITGISNYYKPDEPSQFIEGNGYKGYHTTDCGENSSGNDYLLDNGMITNNLAGFYLRYYRNSIPESEMKKVNELADFYRTKYGDNLKMKLAKFQEETFQSNKPKRPFSKRSVFNLFNDPNRVRIYYTDDNGFLWHT